MAASFTWIQLNLMSDSLGSENFSGSVSTAAWRNSFGNPQPILEPSDASAR